MPGNRKPVNILVVDDEDFFAEWLAENLRDIPDRYDAHWVNSARAALEFIQQQPVDLVISDIKMAGESGLELLKEVRARHPDTGVILMTGYALPGLQQEAVRRGSLMLLEKPFPLERLDAAIEQALKTSVVSGPLSVVKDEDLSLVPGPSSLVPGPSSLVPGQENEDEDLSTVSGPSSLVKDEDLSVVPGPLSVVKDKDEGQLTTDTPGTTVDQRTGDHGPRTSFTMDHGQRTKLQELLSHSEHLEGGALMTTDGAVLVTTLPEASFSPAVALVAGAWSRMGRELAEGLGRGALGQALIQGDFGHVVLSVVKDVPGPWSLVPGQEQKTSLVPGPWSPIPGFEPATKNQGLRTEDQGLRTKDHGPRTKDQLFVLFVTNTRSKLGLALLQARQRAEKISNIIEWQNH
jgi:CheY-like chemotaxis protein/predicted regulator of Ras-like GTPase activity (Roadblock/LC7/MglB family)